LVTSPGANPPAPGLDNPRSTRSQQPQATQAFRELKPVSLGVITILPDWLYCCFFSLPQVDPRLIGVTPTLYLAAAMMGNPPEPR